MNILFVYGIPDDQIGTISHEQIQAGIMFPGNTSIMQTVIEPMLEKGWQVQFAYLGQPTELNIEGVSAVVNCICDASNQKKSLLMLQELIDKTDLPILNKPALVLDCNRDAISAIKFADITVPLTSAYKISNDSLEIHLKEKKHQLPVIIRPVGRHNGIGIQRIHEANEFVPMEGVAEYYVTDFIDYISEDGLYRKYRLIYVGDELFRHHLMVGKDWCLHLDSVKDIMRANNELMDEAACFVRSKDESAEINDLLKIFHELKMDYGMVDYAVDKLGEVVIFEINPCFLLSGIRYQMDDCIRGGVSDINSNIAEAMMKVIDRKAGTVKLYKN